MLISSKSFVLDSSNIDSVANSVHGALALAATCDYDMLSLGAVDYPIFSVMHDDSCLTVQLAQGDCQLDFSIQIGTPLSIRSVTE
jgi:hypothetical protein